ncbi:hypothetical protein [Bacillus sp. S0628]|uniref:hypothetical protein n=1 Tax=Bacillus sp. S0628 TaxID=2957802 RepID=UPI00209FBAB0|nr:hypothetical protein [Bacillus sp. S0628]MCP1324246.1 hypothetical protein [Bacillus sp. S0628]
MKNTRGFGSYFPLENYLGTLSPDEINELYLSGELDKMYDDIEREKQLLATARFITKMKTSRKAQGEMKREVFQWFNRR